MLMRFAYLGCLLAMLGAALLSGCTAAHYEDPLGVMSDPGRGHRERWDAARQAETEQPRSKERIDVLRQMVWEPGHPTEFRIYAIDQLLAIEPGETRAFINKRLPLIGDWQTLDHVIDLAVKNGWKDLTPGLIHHYAIPSSIYKDEDRPERAALEALNPGVELNTLILDFFNDPQAGSLLARSGAWQLLARLEDHDALMQQLLELKATDGLAADLQAAARDLHVIPDNVPTIERVQMLRTAAYSDFWKAAQRVVATLGPEERMGLELRHLAALVHLAVKRDQLLDRSREELLSRLSQFYGGQMHHLEGPTYDAPMSDYPQRLRDWSDQLSWADLVVINYITQQFDNADLVRALFKQADGDFLDTSTEFAGLLMWTADEKVKAVAYEPEYREHDLVYHATKKMMADAATALAHYHFHATSKNNSTYAGPGFGDLHTFGATQELNGLVVTFIDEHRMNVDYYQHENVVIDLGTINR